MNITQGAPLPDIKETTTVTKDAPSYYTNYLTDLSTAGTTALAKKPEELVAGLDPLQQAAYEQTQQAAQAYRPGLEAAQQTMAGLTQGVTPQGIQAFMSPYTQNVVNEMARLSQQNVERSLLPQIRAGMVGTGALGSQRYAGALGQSLADVSKNLTGQQFGALSKGFETALEAAFKQQEAQRGAATSQAELAKTAQALGLQEIGALSKAGAEMQKYEQALLDAPLATAKQAQDLLRGFEIPVDQTTTFTGPRGKDYYQKSPFETATGILALIGSAVAGGGAGTSQTQGAGNALRWIFSKIAPDASQAQIDQYIKDLGLAAAAGSGSSVGDIPDVTGGGGSGGGSTDTGGTQAGGSVVDESGLGSV